MAKLAFTQKQARETIACALDRIQVITGATCETHCPDDGIFAAAYAGFETLHGPVRLTLVVREDHARYDLTFDHSRNPWPAEGGYSERVRMAELKPDSMTRGLTGLSKVKRADLRARTLPTLLSMLCDDLATVTGYQRAG